MEFFRENKKVLALACGVVGVALLALSISAIWYHESTGGWVRGVIDWMDGEVGNEDHPQWSIILFLASAGMVLFGFGYAYSIRKKEKEFRSLMKTNSKAVFLRNLDEIEYLAWSLTSKEEALVEKKKKELGIRRSKRREMMEG